MVRFALITRLGRIETRGCVEPNDVRDFKVMADLAIQTEYWKAMLGSVAKLHNTLYLASHRRIVKSI